MNHMNSRTVVGLGTATLLAIVAAVVITSARKPVIEIAERAPYAFPELRDHINEIKWLTIVGAGNTSLVTVERADQGWVLRERSGYPADLGQVRPLLLRLAEVRLREKKTANEQRYAELGVEDISQPDAQGLLLKVGGLAQPVQVIIGKASARGDGTFIRRPDDRQSWLTESTLSLVKEPAVWLERNLADIAPGRIKEVVLHRPDGKTLRLFKQAGDANFNVADIPKGRELLSESAANGLGAVLSGLRLEDVQPARDAEPHADGKTYRARFTTFDGLVVAITAWKQGDKHLGRFEAGVDPALAEAYIQSEQAKAKTDHEAKQSKEASSETPRPTEPPPLAVSDPVKDREQRLAALESELAPLKQRFVGWTFTLPAHTFRSLDQSVEDLLKPQERSKAGGKKATRSN